jgi:hypothetical protein
MERCGRNTKDSISIYRVWVVMALDNAGGLVLSIKPDQRPDPDSKHADPMLMLLKP